VSSKVVPACEWNRTAPSPPWIHCAVDAMVSNAARLLSHLAPGSPVNNHQYPGFTSQSFHFAIMSEEATPARNTTDETTVGSRPPRPNRMPTQPSVASRRSERIRIASQPCASPVGRSTTTPMQSVNDENDPPGNDAERNAVGALAASSLPTPSRAPMPAAPDDAPTDADVNVFGDYSTRLPTSYSFSPEKFAPQPGSWAYGPTSNDGMSY
jgi:hypothetical protein